jgi:hypothetical protein
MRFYQPIKLAGELQASQQNELLIIPQYLQQDASGAALDRESKQTVGESSPLNELLIPPVFIAACFVCYARTNVNSAPCGRHGRVGLRITLAVSVVLYWRESKPKPLGAQPPPLLKVLDK